MFKKNVFKSNKLFIQTIRLGLFFSCHVILNLAPKESMLFSTLVNPTFYERELVCFSILFIIGLKLTSILKPI